MLALSTQVNTFKMQPGHKSRKGTEPNMKLHFPLDNVLRQWHVIGKGSRFRSHTFVMQILTIQEGLRDFSTAIHLKRF